MFGLPEPFDFIFTLVAFGVSVFGFITLVIVFQTCLAAKEYYERKNREYATRPVQRRA